MSGSDGRAAGAERAWTTRFEVAWGDCDDAGIVFYPHFFRWMDTAFHRFLTSRGSSHRKLTAELGLIGLPIVEAHAEFKSAISYDEEMTVSLEIELVHARRFRIVYRGRGADGRLLFEGHEVRALVRRDAASGRLAAIDIPESFKALIGSR